MKVVIKSNKNIAILVQKYNEKDCLTNFSTKTSNFYGLPKIHKSKLISEAMEEQNSECVSIFEPDDLKLPPIVSGAICPTRPLSYLIDKILKPFIIHVKSFIKDNIDF